MNGKVATGGTLSSNGGRPPANRHVGLAVDISVKADKQRLEFALTSYGAEYMSVIFGEGMAVDE